MARKSKKIYNPNIKESDDWRKKPNDAFFCYNKKFSDGLEIFCYEDESNSTMGLFFHKLDINTPMRLEILLKDQPTQLFYGTVNQCSGNASTYLLQKADEYERLSRAMRTASEFMEETMIGNGELNDALEKEETFNSTLEEIKEQIYENLDDGDGDEESDSDEIILDIETSDEEKEEK